MPVSLINSIKLSYQEYGTGEPVLLIAGSGAPGRTWRAHQVPALTLAGLRTITMDSRGVPPTDLCEEGFTLQDMVADTAALIEHLGIAPCRVVGFSLGALVTQELLVTHPGVARKAVLMATRGRTDALSRAASCAQLKLIDDGITLPPRYEALVNVLRGFSRRTLRDEREVQDWLDLFEMSPVSTQLSRSQVSMTIIPDRRELYRQIRADVLVIGFEDDLIAAPELGREVAESIPRAIYRQIPGCGHYGHLEDPTAVNEAILGFFRGAIDLQMR
jgi:pimeloyl-ACP methyl ester carboxylesterase